MSYEPPEEVQRIQREYREMRAILSGLVQWFDGVTEDPLVESILKMDDKQPHLSDLIKQAKKHTQ